MKTLNLKAGRACFRLLSGVRHRLLAACLAGLALAAPPARAEAEAPAPPDVLILNSYAPGYAWSDDEIAGALGVLRKSHPLIEPVIEYLDFKRFTDPARERWLIEDVADKCRVRPPRLIITFDNAAFDFALKYRARLGPDIPIVFGGMNRFTPPMIAGHRGITGVSEQSDYSGTFALIAHLRPRARRVLVISNQTESGRESRAAFAELRPRYADRYTFEFFDHWTNAELIDRVANLSDDWVGLILDATRDETGHDNYFAPGFSQALSTQARVPVFLTSRPPGGNDWSVYPWDGIGGGMVVADLHGAAVGELAARVLAGESPAGLPVVRYSPQRLEVDYRQMQRFRLSVDQLPPGTQVLNAPVTFYQVNRSRIILTAGVILLLCGIIAALSLNILWRRRAERALRRAEEQLRSAQKLEAIGLLAGGVAHDFNNILQVIRGHAGFLEESLAGAAAPLEDVRTILSASERGAQLTRQLLAFSRKQPLLPEAVEANALVTDLVKMLRRVLGEHIEVQLALLPEPCTFVADKAQLEQVLLNLCVNARDAMPSGGRLRIELKQTTLAAADTASLPELKPGPHLVLTVSDTGCGMRRELVEHLFEPFFTTKAPGHGTGLGLSVVYGVVRQHGGAIRVYSEVGQGSVFRILLPLNPAVASVPTEKIAEEFPAGHGAILLAEDDPQVRRIGERVLAHNGFEVLTAANGEEAEQLIAEHHARLRLVVLDVLMPKRTGREVFNTLRREYPRVRVLFCSGYSADMLPKEIAPEAGVALINKPYTARELLDRVHQLLRD
ncbi:ATP-binding protein [Opitutus terrae]|uniref:histidine kinase n=1 Tax=Opitutus terrae (strain DSM 11246 / JCM 15787 / PB90-1) TaxID=452637 RepID=B1ZX19_OPITP|nr:ATP-binding protein [Opitutus terrae]ACB75130.1 histidine kinase [Opitutus terrae PB90-1]